MKPSSTLVSAALASPLAVLLFGAIATGSVSCSGDGFGQVRNPPRLVVELDAKAVTGSLDAPLDLQVGVDIPFRIVVRALASSGAVDTTFNRFVRISSKPGAISSLVGADTDGRNVLLKDGMSVAVDVNVSNAYGTTYIVADDLGYVPADPLRDPPPKCSNGIDDDGDGLIDFPADPGCAFANDDSEESGTYAEGASRPIYYRLPRIADVRGLQCDPMRGCSGNGKTPYPREQILIDTGWKDDGTVVFDTVVTRISASGFFATDLADKRGGFNSLYAFNFNAPPRMRVCDRMKSFGGTASEFFGFTQISYPTWTLEEWDPAKRLCLVPDPLLLTPLTIGDATALLKVSGGLVRVQTSVTDNSQTTQVTRKFGANDIPLVAGAYVPGPDASNCDFDHNGKIVFTAGDPEAACSNACSADPECTEWSNYVARGTFRLTVTDSNRQQAAIQADSSAAAGFDPVAMKGIPLRSFAGALTFFSGGSQYTIEARCADDILVDLKTPTFPSDIPCTTDDDCKPGAGIPADFKCLPLSNPGAGKACRKTDPAKPDVFDPPPLACVFPRTFLDLNPQ